MLRDDANFLLTNTLNCKHCHCRNPKQSIVLTKTRPRLSHINLYQHQSVCMFQVRTLKSKMLIKKVLKWRFDVIDTASRHIWLANVYLYLNQYGNYSVIYLYNLDCTFRKTLCHIRFPFFYDYLELQETITYSLHLKGAYSGNNSSIRCITRVLSVSPHYFSETNCPSGFTKHLATTVER